ncbi:MAG: iron-sulfur cluster assembly scaffold protein [Acidobacteria bacterium]|nr:MAG: iron-sulfur cluster assembly scaffold protein [Acidobacteriota bacterium]
MYSPQVLDHFERPRNSGVLDHADASVQLENPVCGDVLKLSARIVEGKISEIKFQAQGCVPAIACGSALSELVKGMTINQASALDQSALIRVLGQLPEASSHALALAMDALSRLLKRLGGTTVVSR